MVAKDLHRIAVNDKLHSACGLPFRGRKSRRSGMGVSRTMIAARKQDGTSGRP
jgi:hypothetical protein